MCSRDVRELLSPFSNDGAGGVGSNMHKTFHYLYPLVLFCCMLSYCSISTSVNINHGMSGFNIF